MGTAWDAMLVSFKRYSLQIDATVEKAGVGNVTGACGRPHEAAG